MLSRLCISAFVGKVGKSTWLKYNTGPLIRKSKVAGGCVFIFFKKASLEPKFTFLSAGSYCTKTFVWLTVKRLVTLMQYGRSFGCRIRIREIQFHGRGFGCRTRIRKNEFHGQ